MSAGCTVPVEEAACSPALLALAAPLLTPGHFISAGANPLDPLINP